MDSMSLEIYFLYRDEDHLYKSHPSRYLSHLIGHEGPGSILAYIKGKGWANGLTAGSISLCHGAGLFEISISLTKEGLVNYKEVDCRRNERHERSRFPIQAKDPGWFFLAHDEQLNAATLTPRVVA